MHKPSGCMSLSKQIVELKDQLEMVAGTLNKEIAN